MSRVARFVQILGSCCAATGLLLATGCQSTGWGWNAPSMPSLSAWRPFGSSPAAASDSVARSRPSSKTDAPPAIGSSFAGAKTPPKDVAGKGADPFAGRSRDVSPYGERPGAVAQAGATSPYGAKGYDAKPASADAESGYHTGPYSTAAAKPETESRESSPGVYRGYSSEGVRLGAKAAAGGAPATCESGTCKTGTCSCTACEESAKIAANGGKRPNFKASGSVYGGAEDMGASDVAATEPDPAASEGSFDGGTSDESEAPAAVAEETRQPAPYPSTRTPGLPAALSRSGETYRPGSTNRPVVPAGFNEAAAPATTGSIYR